MRAPRGALTDCNRILDRYEPTHERPEFCPPLPLQFVVFVSGLYQSQLHRDVQSPRHPRDPDPGLCLSLRGVRPALVLLLPAGRTTRDRGAPCHGAVCRRRRAITAEKADRWRRHVAPPRRRGEVVYGSVLPGRCGFALRRQDHGGLAQRRGLAWLERQRLTTAQLIDALSLGDVGKS